MLQLNPTSTLPIVRQLNNPADVTGYYVRATVRNSLLKTVIGTVDLTDDGGGRFTGSFSVPSTENLYFDITTNVFTDAGYTIASETYGSESEQYLSALRWSLSYWNAGDSGADVNYKKIEDIFTKVLGKYEFLSEEDVSEIVDSAKSALTESIQRVERKVSEIDIPEVEMPEPKEVDLSFLNEGVSQLLNKVDDVKFDTETILDTQTALSGDITAITPIIQSAKDEVVAKQDEINSIERMNDVERLTSERDKVLDQLLEVQRSVSGFAPQASKQSKQQPDNEMDLRVKRFLK